MQKIKWGIIGPGSIATAFAHSIDRCQNSELTGVFGRSAEKANDFAKLFSIQSFGSLKDLLLSEDIDAVYVATPHSEHFTYALQAIKHHKHVLCEKPMTMNAHESMILLDLAQSLKVF